MDRERTRRFREFRIKRKYETLLASFFILLFGDILAPEHIDITPFLLIQNVAASLVLFYGKKKWRIPLKTLLLCIVGIEVISIILEINYLRPLFGLVYLVYFFFLSIELFRQILKTKDVSFEMVSAVLCGFIILGLAGSYIFTFIEVLHPGSFANIADGPRRITDLLYYSFISIMSIGYGDIYPLTIFAKKMTMFMGLLGHFYNVIVIGIVIGKYISKR